VIHAKTIPDKGSGYGKEGAKGKSGNCCKYGPGYEAFQMGEQEIGATGQQKG